MSKIQKKAAVLEECVAALRHVVRHNGAPIPADADIGTVADHCTDMSVAGTTALLTDSATIDRLKNVLRDWPKALEDRERSKPYNEKIKITYPPNGSVLMHRPELTTQQVAALPVNDGAQTALGRSWAVLRVSKSGTEILSYGGDYYQQYKYDRIEEQVPVMDEATGEQAVDESGTPITKTTYHYELAGQEGATDLLHTILEAEDAAWMAEVFRADLGPGLPTYTEGGQEFVRVDCTLPGGLDQLISMRIHREAAEGYEGDTPPKPLEYSLTPESCDDSNAGMVALPHGGWLIYDNSTLEHAPQALLLPKAQVVGNEAGIRWTAVEISYNALVSGLARLRLEGDAFGDSYIISTQDMAAIPVGTWAEDQQPSTEPMTIGRALAIRAAFHRIKSKLSEAGVDMTDVQYITDLPGILGGCVTDEVEELLEALVEDAGADTVDELLEALTAASKGVGLAYVMERLRPTEWVGEGDIYA